MAESMRMMADIQRLRDTLPGIDCGACGAPSCRALAEDVVRGRASIDNCLILKTRAPERKEQENDGK
jgi:Na+-translocating ferredoxin:NAD+ oxidoreductase RNF subunit RnfB